MQFVKPFKIAIAEGRVSVSFRCWRSPQAKPGGRYQIRPYGAIEVDAVDLISRSAIGEADATKAGYANRAGLLKALSERAAEGTSLYRIDFHYIGELADPRVALREKPLDPDGFQRLAVKLARMDARETPWTRTVLELIRNQPGTRAGNLAPTLGWALPRFKTQVRKLKAQGLTESLEVGYRLSPRGIDYLGSLEAQGQGERA